MIKLVQDHWLSFSNNHLHCTLKDLREKIRSWSKDNIGELAGKISKLESLQSRANEEYWDSSLKHGIKSYISRLYEARSQSLK